MGSYLTKTKVIEPQQATVKFCVREEKIFSSKGVVNNYIAYIYVDTDFETYYDKGNAQVALNSIKDSLKQKGLKLKKESSDYSSISDMLITSYIYSSEP